MKTSIDSNQKTRASSSITSIWQRLAFANSATRREAKAILFMELAESTKNGMPLDEALEYAMRSTSQMREKPGLFDQLSIEGFFDHFITVLYWLFATCGSVILIMLSSVWAADVERVARVIAIRLLPYIKSGHSLSEAMAILKSDFNQQEINTIRAGEQWHNLPSALEKMAEYQYYERQLQRHWARMAYPFLLFWLSGIVICFIMTFILPKYADIFFQLNFELPFPTGWFVKNLSNVAAIGMVVLSIVGWFVLFGVTLRLLMVGNRTLRDIAALFMFALVIWPSFLLIFSLQDQGKFDGLALLGLIILTAVLGVYLSMFLVSISEKIVLWLERITSAVFGNMPLIGAPRRTELESRWLGALALGIANQTDTPVAIESAGNICGGAMARQSDYAAELVKKGYTIGQAVNESQILRSEYSNRLQLLDSRPDYLKGLQEIAEDATLESYDTLNRASRIAEVISVCMIGLIVAVTAFTMYMPLFQIPLIVGLPD